MSSNGNGNGNGGINGHDSGQGPDVINGNGNGHGNKEGEVVLVTFIFSDKTYYAKDVDINWEHWPVQGIVFHLLENKKDAEYMPAKELKAVLVTTFDSDEEAQIHINKEIQKNGGRKHVAFAVTFIR